jgi:hypothetical protein
LRSGLPLHCFFVLSYQHQISGFCLVSDSTALSAYPSGIPELIMNESISNNAPALVFVKDLSTWLVVNNKSEPTIWLGDPKELAWFFASILELVANEQKKLVVEKAATKALDQNASRRMPRRSRVGSPAVSLPMR